MGTQQINARAIRFLEEDLTLFCEASGDRNPLHLSEDYASRTAYGQRVVYGVLGAIACLGSLELSFDQRISRVTADFHRPMFLNVDYRIEKSGSVGTQIVRLFDGTVLVLTLAIAHDQTIRGQLSLDPWPGLFERTEARELSWADIQPGLKFSGRYAASFGKLGELCRQWNVIAPSFVVEALLWSSYFIGMEFPGRHALFFRLLLDFAQESTPQSPFHYHGVVSSLNKAVEQTKVRITLSSSEFQLASGLLTAFVRPKLHPFDFRHLLPQSSPADSLKGKIALIIGASRGLGAALTASIALEGAHVIAISRSPVEFGAALPAHVKQRIVPQSGDSTSIESVSALHKMIVEKFGKLDFLICNAFPPIPALRLETNALARVQIYLKQSTDLVLVPLCVFLPLLNENRGCAVIISSSAVERPVREWPHYVAAKSAIESFGFVAPLQYPNVGALIVRPERLLTDMTNTPMGRQKSMPPVMFARQITKKLQSPPASGTAEIFRGDQEELAND
jgi:NAD(P)-dependent dehydrogenase (short-subunit alcohol dehydrogenase family)